MNDIEFAFHFKVKAQSQKEAGEKVEAAATFIKHLSHSDLLLFANAVKNKPTLIQQAKKFL